MVGALLGFLGVLFSSVGFTFHHSHCFVFLGRDLAGLGGDEEEEEDFWDEGVEGEEEGEEGGDHTLLQ